MRPRFSLRWLLIGFTVLTIAFYFLFVRPTMIAQQLVASVKSTEFKPGSLLPSGDKEVQGTWKVKDAYLQPREWSDVWRCQRRAQVIATLNNPPGSPTRMLVNYTAGPLHTQMNQLQLIDVRN